MIVLRMTDERLQKPELILLAILNITSQSVVLDLFTAVRIVGGCLYDEEKQSYLSDEEAASYLAELSMDKIMELVDQGAAQLKELARLAPFRNFIENLDI